MWKRVDATPSELAQYLDDNMALYDASVYWVDRQIGRLLEMVRQFGLQDDTAVAITADHGEELLEHGRPYHRPGALPEALIRVPLMIRAPGVSARTLPNIPFSQIDLPATLLEVSGCSSKTMPGEAQWSKLLDGEQEPCLAITERVADCGNPVESRRRMGARLLTVHDGRYKLVWRLADDGPSAQEQLFDVVADPGEKSPLAPGEALEVRRRLMQAALEHVKKSRAERDPVARLRARLRDARLEGPAAFR